MNTNDRRRVLAPLLLVSLAGIIAVALLSLRHAAPAPRQVPLSSVLRLSTRHQIARVRLEGDGTVQVLTRAGQTLLTRKEDGQILSAALTANGADVSVDAPPLVDLGSLIAIALLLLTGGGLLAFTVRRAPGVSSRLRSGRAVAAAQVTPPSVTFDAVGGVDEVKGELIELVTFLRTPDRFAQIGARIPRGVLLSGPPGTGKTLLARAVAGEARVPFFSMSGSAFVEMYVGVGAARVRELFARARKAAPCIVFIDEIDAVGGRRSSGKGAGGNDEREQTLNQLLVEMDGFTADAGVIVLAATNRPDLLDSALLRPGRFDRRVVVPLPDRAGRRAVLSLHAASVALAEAVDLDALAAQTSGMSPADLANVVNEAALNAARQGVAAVTATHLDDAVLRVLAGPELTSRVMSPALKRVIAYHEVGHAVVMRQLPHCDPVVKVQAIARGNALGITVSRPSEDQYLLTRSALIERMVGLMGGRAAEEVFFDEVTTGAQQDIAQANVIARRMVGEFGMSSLGHVCVSDSTPLSPDLAARIDEATRGLVDDAYARARTLVFARKAAITAIADHLIEVETIDGAKLDQWLDRYPAASSTLVA